MELTTTEWMTLGLLVEGALLVMAAAYIIVTNGKRAGLGVTERIKNEPALLGTLVGYIALVAGHYGLSLPSEFEAIAGFVLFLLTGVAIRSRVSPVRTLPDAEVK